MLRYLVFIVVCFSVSGVPCEANNVTHSIDFHMLKHFYDARSGLPDGIICGICEATFDVFILNRKATVLNDQNTLPLFELVCKALKLFVNDDVCSKLVKFYEKVIVHVIDNKKDLTGNHICAILLQARKCKDKTSPTFSINVAEGTNPSRPIGDPVAEPTIIGHITDIHYDPNYSSMTTATCGKPLCCQTDSGTPKHPSDKAGYWTDYRSCDIPIYTIEKTLEYMSTMKMERIYFTGDIISHRIWDTAIEKNKNDINQVFSLFEKYFPNTPIYPVLGNHESHPLNLFAPDELKDSEFSTQWLYDNAWENWKRWLPESTKDTILRGGFYTVVVKPGFRIIALNNNVAYILNFWLLYKDDDTYGQLQWFADTLAIAEQNQETVHVLMHSPNGDSETYVPWARQFAKIVERFPNTITAFFYGHLHTAEISVLYKNSDQNDPISVGFNGGSLTPFFDYNGNFRTYKADPVNMNILDYDEYTFNLTAANANSIGSIPWYKLYSFKKEYGVKSMSPKDLSQLAVDMSQQPDLRNKYFRNQVRYGDPALVKGCDRECQRENICRYVTTVYDNRTICEALSKNIN